MSITLLHLSDLQFGRHHADDSGGRAPLYEKNKYDAESQKIISDFKILKKIGVNPNYLILSGDISETSTSNEYSLAIDYINKIIKFFSIDKKNVILVPSNHDINRTLCQSARLRAKALNEEFNPPYFEKFEIYKSFFDELYSDITWKKNETAYSFEKEKLYGLYVFHDKKIAFIGLNSCIDESEINPHYGNITIEQCKMAFDELNEADPEKKYNRIAVMHHNFIRSSDYDEENLKDSDEILPIFIKNNVSLILHGHQHATKSQHIGIDNITIPILASGSAGLDSNTLPENCRRYQFVELDNEKIRIYKRRFDNKKTHVDGKGCWTSDMSPSDDKIYSEIDVKPHGKKNIKAPLGEKYDLYKIQASDNALRGKDILVLAYPRREIELIDRVLDHKSKIYYEYLSVKVELDSCLYFLFVGKNINQTATLGHFLHNNDLPSSGLTICTPRVMSKGDGGSEFRAKNIENTIKQTIHDKKKFKSYLLSVNFIDDYVWKNCLDLSFRKQKFIISELPYYIDQNIYKIKDGKEVNLGLSLDYFADFFDKQYEEKTQFFPISIILASGGMGKSTLCDKIANIINKYEKKKAIYINAEDIKEKLEYVNYEIKTIGDLFLAYDTVNGSKHTSLHDPNNLEINISCGNIIVIIDGLDEIESSLMDKFDIDNFLNSIVNMDNYFNNCRLIFTSRDYHKEKYINREGVAVFYLKGFDDQNVVQYFRKRFSGNESQSNKSLDYVKRLNIKVDNFYMPLFLQLIADTVQRETYSEKIKVKRYLNTELLKTDFVLDDLIVRLTDREIDKQKLGISIDQFVELLNEIVVTNFDNMSLEKFHEYIEICMPKTGNNAIPQEIYTKYYINPLLEIDNDRVHLKYDVVSLLIKTRFIQNCIEKNNYRDEIIPLLAENPYGTGSIIEELLLPNNANAISINSLSELISFLKRRLNIIDDKYNKELTQKAISFTIYLGFKIENPHDKKDRIALVNKLFKGDLKNLCVYGSFFPLDFNGIKIYDSQFVGYNNLFLSDFPQDDLVFYYCSFVELQINKSRIIPKSVFDDTCNIPVELRNYFAASKEVTKKHYLLIKNDLKKFFKSFVISNVFFGRSLNKINSNFMTKFDRKIFIGEMDDKKILYSKIHKGNKLYYIDEEYQPSVLSLINQNNLDPNLESFCNYLMTEYYKI